MITLTYDRYDTIRKSPYPNGWHTELYNYADTINDNEYMDIVKEKFKLSTSHSELKGNVLYKHNGKYVILKNMNYQNYNGEILFYPIEIYGSHNHFIENEIKTTNDNIEYKTLFIDVVSKEAIELAKQNKLIFVFNISHEPFSDLNFLKQF